MPRKHWPAQLAYMRSWRGRNPDRARELCRESNARVKADVIAAYGGKCVKCGFVDPRALQVDHVNGGGHRHLKALRVSKGTSFYYWLRKNGYPTEFQLLCANCNWIKRVENQECRSSGRYQEAA